MSISAQSISRHLYRSLIESPLLVGDLTVATVFDRSLLSVPADDVVLEMEQKLGHLYEDALEALIVASPAVALIASHLQVFAESGRTIGELDFLLKHQQRAIHLELAVKFYLAVETERGWQFPGPNPRDNWQRKLDRMREHQLMLCQRPAAKVLLCERFEIDAVQVQQLIYGCLFYPISNEARPLPDAVNPNCRQGRWLYIREWESYFGDVDFVRIVPKVLWPVELSLADSELLEEVPIQELHQRAQKRCTLFSLLDSNEAIFLVPDDWLSVES